jgi:4-diphosphocytidyl-2-C-methyl-D-erythritol kinase
MKPLEQTLGGPEPWPAPGKLNLFLHVVGRRADGYHRLQTAFQFIDLADDICFLRRPAGIIERITDVPGVPVDDDLVLQAARTLAARAPDRAGVAIELIKNLPIQAGVGGGSSDAATTLVALNQLWELGLSSVELARIGLSLGADVPVFVLGRAAWAEDIGQQLTPVDFPERVYLLIRPGTAVATADVFKAPELTRDSPVIKIRDFLKDGGRNDCEPVVRRRYPEVAEALDWLAAFGDARLTGTGSCVYASMPDEEGARAVLAGLPGRWMGYVVRGLNRSPLLERSRLEHDRSGSGR